MLAVWITPAGHWHVEAGEASSLIPRDRAIINAFSTAGGGNTGSGLLHLAKTELGTTLQPELAFGRSIGQEYLTQLCHAAALEGGSEAVEWKAVPPPEEMLSAMALRVPLMKGSEYVNAGVLAEWWRSIDAAARERASTHPLGLQGFLREASPQWRMIGRVTFHLAENKKTPERPFAFLATYARRISDQARVQHQPLGAALREYGGAKDRERLIALLTPIERAAEKSAWVRDLVETGQIYRPLGWTPEQAYQFLQALPALEESGLLVRVPNWWRSNRPPRPAVSVRVGDTKKSALGLEALLDFRVGVVLDGQPLTPAEVRELLASSGGLVLLKGQWVEVDKQKLKEALDHWETARGAAREGGVTFLEAMRMLSGVRISETHPGEVAAEAHDWSEVSAGDWLSGTLAQMRARTEASAEADPTGLRASLRPYQRAGVSWLSFLSELGLGACLADDMGLGKTVQVLGLLMKLRGASHRETSAARGLAAHLPNLLVVPASLIGNWKAEIAKFAPDLRYKVAHPSESADADVTAGVLNGHELVITTYGMLLRLEELRQHAWNLVILDEAQAIKNSGTRQARAVKQLHCRGRIALTGTPVENRLSDLWSLFDFLNPGLLGNAADFGRAVKRMEREGTGFGPLRALVQPYLLRRLKTDRNIIADLPEKTEVRAYCPLSRRQAALYEQAVHDLARQLNVSDGIQRRGIVLAYLMRFKQICNHPDQWLGSGDFDPDDSGKFGRLREICGEMAERQERVLVFTQFREMTRPLAGFLADTFGRPGLVLHGETPVGKRRGMVEEFQQEDGPPFFVLSLKAGGTGLNLTAASQVIHFDRWWNPAVENQATDRAFRIGQKKNVLVHKFICRGTLEDRIDEMIEGKQSISRDVLQGGAEKLLTEMPNDELLRFVSLDIRHAEQAV